MEAPERVSGSSPLPKDQDLRATAAATKFSWGLSFHYEYPLLCHKLGLPTQRNLYSENISFHYGMKNSLMLKLFHLPIFTKHVKFLEPTFQPPRHLFSF